MIPSKARTHERHSGLLPLAAEVPREVRAASYLLRKKRYLNIFLNLPTKGILSQERSVRYHKNRFRTFILLGRISYGWTFYLGL